MRRTGLRGVAACLVVLWRAGVGAAADEIVLADRGAPRAVIVIAEKAGPGPREAARVFAELAEKISGAKIPIASDRSDAASKRPVVCIGASKLTGQLGVTIKGLGASGVRIASGRDFLILAGPDTPQQIAGAQGKARNLPLNPRVPSGTTMAVLTFLMDQWNVDWLFPDDLGLAHPSRPHLTAPTGLDVRYTPPLANRRIRNVMHNSRAETGAKSLGLDPAPLIEMERTASRWLRLQRTGIALTVRSGHSFGEYWERYGKQHPEWFALQPDGTRKQGKGNRERLCLSNPGLRDQVVKDVKAHFEKHPTAASFSICLNDGGRPWFCTCDPCKAWDTPEAGTVRWGRRTVPNMSDRVWRFSTDIAARIEKQCPGKVLTAYAYSAYRDAPRRKLHFPANPVIGVVGGAETLAAWRGIGGEKFWRPNIFDMSGMGRNAAARIGADIRAAHQAGVTITDLDCNLGHWAPEAINYYVAAKMLWDPASRPETWVDRFCRLAFGKGAPAMAEYFARCADLDVKIRAAARAKQPSRRAMQNYKAFWTDKWFKTSEQLIRRAETQAQGDARALARVRRYRTGLEITRFRVGYFTAKARWQQAIRTYRAAKDKRAARPALEKARAKMKQWDADRKTLYNKHVNTWILNVCYLGFYRT